MVWCGPQTKARDLTLGDSALIYTTYVMVIWAPL